MKLIEDIACVILAGGKSSRMGQDKALMPFQGYNSLIEYQYKKFKKLFKYVYISSKTDKFNFPCKIIYDTEAISSPMIALKSIFDYLTTKKVFILTVDVPFIHTQTIKFIINNSNNYEITFPFDGKKEHYLCGIFNISTKETVNYLLNHNIHKIQSLIKNVNSYKALELLNPEQFLNINTQKEYDEATVI